MIPNIMVNYLVNINGCQNEIQRSASWTFVRHQDSQTSSQIKLNVISGIRPRNHCFKKPFRYFWYSRSLKHLWFLQVGTTDVSYSSKPKETTEATVTTRKSFLKKYQTQNTCQASRYRTISPELWEAAAGGYKFNPAWETYWESVSK